ncbi:MAG: DedA family protein [Chitinophagales bacterium]|nr:DedA family protein [Chitinophagales bacterium]MCO5281475.1 DedA family protein [Chitinophagales bacterium]HRN93430.1 DedA family protein [Chitinophagales bacterium]HRP38510.1 DedA family protein [Chitinophagales bacterium]
MQLATIYIPHQLKGYFRSLMEYIGALVDFILHIDKHLIDLVANYHHWVYLILFLIIFVETGLVVMPFLPGDSLLFATGMLAAQGAGINVWTVIVILLVAAILGDACNYFIGRFAGEKFIQFKLFGKQLVKPEYIQKTHEFYDKHGPQTIIIARFVPIVRTFAPFVAGIGHMKYNIFALYNVIGGAIWIIGITLLGYFLGEIDIIKNNFEKVVFIIIGISVLPIVYGVLKERMAKKKV